MEFGMIAPITSAQAVPFERETAISTGSRSASFPQGRKHGSIRSLCIPGPAGDLEAVLNYGSPDAPFAALICHPHPIFGGNLHNKVVYSAMKVFNDPCWGLIWPVLRFNFRGAGLSEGKHDGNAEVEDVIAALDWLRREFHLPLVVVGFSFGAAMVLRACEGQNSASHPQTEHLDVRALVALGLPIKAFSPAYNYSFLRDLANPKLFLSGDCDQFAPANQLAQVTESAAEPKRLVLLPDVDHFFTGHLEPMQRAIANWIKEQLQ
jgi:uncharacterized protein